MPLFAQGVKAGTDDAEMFGTVERAEAARDFLFDFRHAHGALGFVVCKWYGEIADEAQHRVGMIAKAA